MTGNILPVILSGGSGSKLWPLSRTDTPKQFLNLTNEDSLFQETIKRVSRFQSPIIVANEEHRFLIAEQLRVTNAQFASLILEPIPRDTAPAVALAALEAISNGHKDDILLVLPADQVIEDEEAFMESVEAGFSLVNSGKIVMFGSTPTCAKSNYSYIEMGSDIDGYGHDVVSYIENPQLNKAQHFVSAGNYLWGTGIFMFTPQQYMEKLEQYDSEIARSCRVSHVERRIENDFIRPGIEAFEACSSHSLNYTFVNDIKNTAVVPLLTPWHDVGGWNDLWEVMPKNEEGNYIKGNVVTDSTTNSFIHSESGIVSVIGLENIIVAQTHDATLIASKDKAGLVKKVFKSLQGDNTKYTSHDKTYISCGHKTVIQENSTTKYAEITINPECSTRLKRYHKRQTYWIITSGSGILNLNETHQHINKGESICMQAGSVYNIKNITDKPLKIMEVSLGDMNEKADFITSDTQQKSILPVTTISGVSSQSLKACN